MHGRLVRPRGADNALLSLHALILLCSVPLLLRATHKNAQPDRCAADADAVNWQLVDRVLSTQPPVDPSFRSQLSQDKWVSCALSVVKLLHAC